MKTIEELLRNLARPEVLEFGLVTNRLPSVNIGGKFEPVDDEAPSTERLMQMLVTMGGGRHVDSLGDKPVQWTTRVDGVGVVAVAAIMRKDVVQARFTVAKREGGGTIRVSVKEKAADPKSTPAQPAAARAPSSQMRAGPSVQMTAVKATQQLSAPPSPVAPPAAPVPAAGSVPSSARAIPVAPPEPPPAAPPPPEDEWDDDDEPTLQTLSPPVSGQPGALKKTDPTQDLDTAAKARAAAEKATAEKAAAEKAAAEKAAAEKAEAEKAAAAQAAAEKAAAEKAAREKAAAEKAAAGFAAAEKAAAEKAAAEKAAAEKAAAEKVAAETAAREKLERETAEREKAAAEKRASERAAPGPRRISTPTSVDAVEVDLVKKEAPKPPPSSSPAASEPKLRPRVPSQIQPPPSTAAVVPEKDRPKVDAGATLDSLLAMAVQAQASDLHIIAGRPVLLRVATDLVPRTQTVPAEHVERIAKDIVPARLREPFERDGACDFAVEHPTYGRFRVHVAKHRGGFKVGMRVVPRELPTVHALGLPDRLASSVNATRGLVLVTGPAASGKSTTIAALVDHVNRDSARHVLTIEEPIEHLHPRRKGLVSQREVGLHTRSTKARALANALGEDADVLVVPDARDADVVRVALQACEAGRLVILGMNMPTARIAIDRILDLFDPREEPWVRATLAASLRVVSSQRLVPSADRTRVHAAFEVLPWSVRLHGLVRDGRTHDIPALQQLGPALGVLRLDEALAELVRSGKSTLDVTRPLAEAPDDFEALVARARK